MKPKDIFIKDNKSKNTLVCIHGFGSSKDFIKNLPDRLKNYNIVSYTVDVDKDLRFENMVKTANYVISRTKGKIFLLAHSLGGAVALSQINNKRVKGIYLVCPIHPYILKTKNFMGLKAIYKPSNIAEKIIGIAAKKAAMKDEKSHKFLTEGNGWDNLIKEDLLSEKFISELDERYRKSSKTINLIYSDSDNVISTKHLERYKQDANIINTYKVKGNHNPMDNKNVSHYLDTKVNYKKRWFGRKVYKG